MPSNPNQVVILKELFEYLFSDTTQSDKLRTIGKERRARIKKKIEDNFINTNPIRTTFSINLATVTLIERFIKDQIKLDDQPVLNLVDRIQAIYMRLKGSSDFNVALENPLIFDDIANELIYPYELPETFFPGAKSVVLYFFEMCDIGKIPDSDDIDKQKPLSQTNLFDDQDDK